MVCDNGEGHYVPKAFSDRLARAESFLIETRRELKLERQNKNLLEETQRAIHVERQSRECLKRDLDLVKEQLTNLVSSVRVNESRQPGNAHGVKFQDTMDINYCNNPLIQKENDPSDLKNFEFIPHLNRRNPTSNIYAKSTTTTLAAAAKTNC